MDHPPVNEDGSARFAVVGAESPTGALLRAALAANHVPGSQVNLYGVADGEAVISEYDGEARLIQDPNLPEIMAHRIIYLCEPGELTDQVIAFCGPDNTVIDLVDCLPADVEGRLVHPDVNPAALDGHRGYLSLPHALASTLAELLLGVEQGPGVEQAEATVLRPASDFGQAGLEELRQQTVRLLSFAEVPEEIFGGQLAFNTLNEPDNGPQGPALSDRVRDETRRLLGWERQRLALRLLTVPVFYGHGVLLHLRTRSPCTLAELTRTLQSSPFFGPPVPASEATPQRVASESAIVVARPTEDGLGGFWLWAVAGEVEPRLANLALRLARISGPAAPPRLSEVSGKVAGPDETGSGR